MQFNIVAAALFAIAASATSYTKPASSGKVRAFANGMVQDFGSKGDAFRIKKIVLTPSKPVAGKPLDVHLIGKLKKTIDQGSKVTIDAKYNGASIMDLELDACQLAKDRKFKHQCPQKPTHLDVHHTLRIPEYAPKGAYSINAYGFNQDNVRIFNVSISHKSKEY